MKKEELWSALLTIRDWDKIIGNKVKTNEKTNYTPVLSVHSEKPAYNNGQDIGESHVVEKSGLLAFVERKNLQSKDDDTKIEHSQTMRINDKMPADKQADAMLKVKDSAEACGAYVSALTMASGSFSSRYHVGVTGNAGSMYCTNNLLEERGVLAKGSAGNINNATKIMHERKAQELASENVQSGRGGR